MLRPIPRRRALSRRLFNVRVDSANGPPWPGMGTPIAHARLMTGISARRIAGWSIGFSTDEIWIGSTLQIISKFAPRDNDNRRSLDTALCLRTTGDSQQRRVPSNLAGQERHQVAKPVNRREPLRIDKLPIVLVEPD